MTRHKSFKELAFEYINDTHLIERFKNHFTYSNEL